MRRLALLLLSCPIAALAAACGAFGADDSQDTTTAAEDDNVFCDAIP